MLPKDIHIRLHYLMEQHDGEKDISELTKRKPACETHTLSVLETIQDIRGAHEELDLDLQGFRYVKAPTKFDDWASENEIRKFLIPEIEDLLRQEMEGCDEIHVIDIKQQHENSSRELVHVDYTASSVVSLVHKMYETKAEYLLGGRVRLINIWRPIRGIVYKSPIAIADGREVDPEKDISTIDTGTPMRHASHRKDYDWYYMSEQAEEDVLLFKTYDSDQSVSSTTCLRTTFDIPNTSIETPVKTIEIQALVFTHPISNLVADDRQSEEEIELLKKKITLLSDEISESHALVRAGLDLRRWESKTTAERIRHLTSDRDHSRAETLSLSMQLNYLEDWITNLYMSWSSSSHYNPLVDQMQHLICSSPRLHQRLGQDQQAHISHVQSTGLYGPDAEILLLRQQLQAQHAENKRLEARINAQVEDGMNDAFVSALQTAVKHERRKDNTVIEDLRQEIQRLNMALEAKTSEVRSQSIEEA